MKTALRNMMATSPFNRQEPTMAQDHIREVGPHPHDWQVAHTDPSNNMYQECGLCGTRRFVFSGGIPRQDWVDGAPWELEEAAQSEASLADPPRDPDSARSLQMGRPREQVESPQKQAERMQEQAEQLREQLMASKFADDENREPSDSQVRRMSKPSLTDLADQRGIDRSDDPTREMLADRIIAARSQG